MRVFNVHERVISAPASAVFEELSRMGTDGDRVWPAPRIPFRRSPGPLRVGETRERHGIIRAVLSACEPDRRIEWRADLAFLEGSHAFEILPRSEDSVVVRHVLDANLRAWFAPVWWLKMAKLHDEIVESLLDRLVGAVADAPGVA